MAWKENVEQIIKGGVQNLVTLNLAADSVKYSKKMQVASRYRRESQAMKRSRELFSFTA
ncbi:MAG: hypothetical protein M3371_12880 [Acidobacteriota bacterium]|jgi:hypothetical protein|nr:hypothetical protein [Acidobacteriota bacterium]